MIENFDFTSFQRALAATVAARGVSWKSVSEETGVSQSTLSRMATGRQPDAASLTAIAAWSGLNPVDFFGSKPQPTEPMAMVSTLLRSDPRLDDQGAEALEAIIRAAYERFRLESPNDKE
jgi:transcriptional regulator with XRE-family HTH domain